MGSKNPEAKKKTSDYNLRASGFNALAVVADTGPAAKASRWVSGQVVQYERMTRPQTTPKKETI